MRAAGATLLLCLLHRKPQYANVIVPLRCLCSVRPWRSPVCTLQPDWQVPDHPRVFDPRECPAPVPLGARGVDGDITSFCGLADCLNTPYARTCALLREQKVTETSTFGGTTYRFPADQDAAGNAVKNLRSRDSSMLAHFPVFSESMLLPVGGGGLRRGLATRSSLRPDIRLSRAPLPCAQVGIDTSSAGAGKCQVLRESFERKCL
jgi:hypothetical protein